MHIFSAIPPFIQFPWASVGLNLYFFVCVLGGLMLVWSFGASLCYITEGMSGRRAARMILFCWATVVGTVTFGLWAYIAWAAYFSVRYAIPVICISVVGFFKGMRRIWQDAMSAETTSESS
jgi:hypothetical protein